MSKQMAGLVTGHGKEFIAYFSSDRLETIKKKYGKDIKIFGEVTMQAAAPTRIKPTLSKNDFASENNKKAKQAKPAKVEKPVKVEKPKREYLNDKAHNVKAVVCVTTGVYYPSMQLAAQAVGTAANNISRLIRANYLKGPRGTRRKTAGCEFRLATPKEVKQQMADVMPVKKAYVSKSQYAPGKHPNSQLKACVPVINITKGTYHISAAAAAKAINGHGSAICHAMKFIGKKGNPPTHKKCRFRHATPEEIKVQRMLP